MTESLAALQAHHHPETERNHVLIVDDDDSIRNLARIVIKRALPGLNIIEARHPHEAISHLLREGIANSLAFVWTDNSMPEMLGQDFARMTRGHDVSGNFLPQEHVQALRHVPILMMTSDNNPYHHQLVEEGVLQHVGRKGIPGGLADLFANIHSAIQNASALKIQAAPAN